MLFLDTLRHLNLAPVKITIGNICLPPLPLRKERAGWSPWPR